MAKRPVVKGDPQVDVESMETMNSFYSISKQYDKHWDKKVTRNLSMNDLRASERMLSEIERIAAKKRADVNDKIITRLIQSSGGSKGAAIVAKQSV